MQAAFGFYSFAHVGAKRQTNTHTLSGKKVQEIRCAPPAVGMQLVQKINKNQNHQYILVIDSQAIDISIIFYF